MFAIIETGGKQYKVAQNDVIKVEKLDIEAGKTVTFDKVLVIGEGADLKLGKPYVEKAVVTGEVVDQAKDKKIIVFKKKRRHNYRRKQGHRQNVTYVKIASIGDAVKAAAPKKEAAKPAAKKAEAKPAAKKPAAAKKPTAKKDTK